MRFNVASRIEKVTSSYSWKIWVLSFGGVMLLLAGLIIAANVLMMTHSPGHERVDERLDRSGLNVDPAEFFCSQEFGDRVARHSTPRLEVRMVDDCEFLAASDRLDGEFTDRAWFKVRISVDDLFGSEPESSQEEFEHLTTDNMSECDAVDEVSDSGLASSGVSNINWQQSSQCFVFDDANGELSGYFVRGGYLVSMHFSEAIFPITHDSWNEYEQLYETLVREVTAHALGQFDHGFSFPLKVEFGRANVEDVDERCNQNQRTLDNDLGFEFRSARTESNNSGLWPGWCSFNILGYATVEMGAEALSEDWVNVHGALRFLDTSVDLEDSACRDWTGPENTRVDESSLETNEGTSCVRHLSLPEEGSDAAVIQWEENDRVLQLVVAVQESGDDPADRETPNPDGTTRVLEALVESQSM